MPSLAAAALALALAAASGKLPYPAPRLLAPTDKTKCDTGELVAVHPTQGELKMRTPAGIVTYKAGPEVQVFDKAGQPLGAIAELEVGQRARIYYVIDDGAKVAEVDLQ